MRVGNKSPEPIRCHGNTNRETTYGDFGDNLVGRAVDHGNVIGVSVGDKRDWAKAEDAKANAKIVNSKARRYVFIVKDVGLTRALFLTRARRWTQRCVGGYLLEFEKAAGTAGVRTNRDFSLPLHSTRATAVIAPQVSTS